MVTRWRSGAVTLAALVSVAGCAGPVRDSGPSTPPTGRPTSVAAVQRSSAAATVDTVDTARRFAACRRVGAMIGSRDPLFEPSSLPVPGPVGATGFGTPAAECAVDGDRYGVHYVALVWTTSVSAAAIARYERSLTSAGFQRERPDEPDSLRAPAGIPVLHRGDRRPTQLRSVSVIHGPPPVVEGFRQQQPGADVTVVMWI